MGGTRIRESFPDDKEVRESIQLNDLLEVFHLKKAIIKMDVETHEYQVLKGADEFFMKVDVKVILMEWIGKSLQEKKLIWEFMNSFKFVPYHSILKQKLSKNKLLRQILVDVIWIKYGYENVKI